MFGFWTTKLVQEISERAHYIEPGWRIFIMATEMTIGRNGFVTKPSEQEVLITRVFDAPRELVFRAWTDPKHLAQWWAPKGCTNNIHEMDVNPGGACRLFMHRP